MTPGLTKSVRIGMFVTTHAWNSACCTLKRRHRQHCTNFNFITRAPSITAHARTMGFGSPEYQQSRHRDSTGPALPATKPH